MFAVIDCGTSTSRVYLVNEQREILASGYKSVGVRDTSITGSRDTLRRGLTELFNATLRENAVPRENVRFAVASGMITSEIGLMEIPHLTAPAGVGDLAESIVPVPDGTVLSLGCPIYFIRGIKTAFPPEPGLGGLNAVDFMRGEEVQCVGAMERYALPYPCNLITLSSHTKIIRLNEKREIAACRTTISGQLYAAVTNATSIGASLRPAGGDEPGSMTEKEILDAARDYVDRLGLARACMMPRFLQMFEKTSAAQRQLFLSAAIAADDMKTFRDMRSAGFLSDCCVLYGHEIRCGIYEHFLRQEFGGAMRIEKIHEREELERLTVDGAIAVAMAYRKKEKNC